MSCRYCKKFKKEQTFPPEIFVISSNGLNKLPDESVHVYLFLDENIHERLDKENLPPHYQELLNWLVARNGKRISAIGSTVALEHAHSTDNKRPKHSLDIFEDINSLILRGPGGPIRVNSSFDMARTLSAVHFSGVQVLVAMTEIAWTRKRIWENNAKLRSFRNCTDFMEWRTVAFPSVDAYASTILCIAAMMGNAEAQNCLKLNKKKDNDGGKLLKNAAFDTVHLAEYLMAAAIGASNNSPRLAVFVTGDKALAQFIKNQHFIRAKDQLVLGFEFAHPWIRRNADFLHIMEQFEICRSRGQPTATNKLGRLASTAIQDLAGKEVPEFKRLWDKIIHEL